MKVPASPIQPDGKPAEPDGEPAQPEGEPAQPEGKPAQPGDKAAQPGGPENLFADLETAPLTRAEYISALTHLYRGELTRSISWRLRLDATTNWAIFTAAGLLTFVFGQGQHSHWPLLMGLPVVAVFHGLEARRFRMWHVWETRVRVIEENFYSPILRRDMVSPTANWGRLVAGDLFQPTFKLSRLDALRARLVRNYWAIYGALIVAWMVKVFLWRRDTFSALENLAAGNEGLPWWTGPVFLSVFVCGLVALLLYHPKRPDAEIEYFQDVDPNDARVDF